MSVRSYNWKPCWLTCLQPAALTAPKWALTFHWTGQRNHRNPGRLWSRSMGQQDSHPHQSCAAGWVWCSPWRDSPAHHQSLALILCISHTCRTRQRDHVVSVLPHSQISSYAPIIRTKFLPNPRNSFLLGISRKVQSHLSQSHYPFSMLWKVWETQPYWKTS